VDVGVSEGVGVQAAIVVVTADEITLAKGSPLFTSPVLARVTPQLLTVPETVSAPEAPLARLPRLQTTCWPVTAGEPLQET
jgi:hypothetical protein